MSSNGDPIVTDHCEHEFWKHDNKIDLPKWLSEPFCAVSGLVMIFLAVWCTAGLDHPPLQFCIARASLVVCGLGTAAFHMFDQEFMDETRLNGIMLDGVTMAMVTVNIFLMHLSNWMKVHLLFWSVLSMLYLLFWTVTNDMLLFKFLSEEWSAGGVSMLSIGIQYPLFVLVYVYILIRVYQIHGVSDVLPMWVALVIALVAWAANQFGCRYTRLLFIGHVVWHICIGYVAVYLMVLGLLNDVSGLEMKHDQCSLFVEVTEKSKLDHKIDASKLFNPAQTSVQNKPIQFLAMRKLNPATRGRVQYLLP